MFKHPCPSLILQTFLICHNTHYQAKRPCAFPSSGLAQHFEYPSHLCLNSSSDLHFRNQRFSSHTTNTPFPGVISARKVLLYWKHLVMAKMKDSSPFADFT